MAIEDVVVRLRAEVDAFRSQMQAAKGDVEDIGKAGEASGDDVKSFGKDLLTAAGSAKVAQKGWDFLKGAQEDASQLAKSTAGLRRQTGMDTKTSSAWVSMAKQRGIEGNALTTMFTKYSKVQASAIGGNEGAAAALEKLGVSTEDLKSGNIDMYGTLIAAADAFSDMEDGAEKTALATQLFGKQGLALLPILNSGSAALEDNLAAVDKAGLTMDDKGVKSSLDFAKAQRDLKTSMQGVKTTIGAALVPVLATLASAVVPVVQFIAEALNKVPGLSAAVVTLGSAFAGLLMINKVLSLLKTLGLVQQTTTVKTLAQAAATGIATAAEWAWNAAKAVGAALMAVSLGWIVLIIAAVAAVIAGIVLLVMNWSTVWNAIKAATAAAIGFVVGLFNSLVSFVSSLPGKIGSFLSKIPGIVSQWFNAAKDKAIEAFNSILTFVTELPGKIGNLLSGIGGAIWDAIKGVLSGVIPGPLKSLFGLATGGIVAAQLGTTTSRGSTVLVGERGPEILSLPSGSRVTPLPPPALVGSQLAGGGERPIITQVYLDGRMIARAVGAVAADQAAAR
jgi:hypothetical protein